MSHPDHLADAFAYLLAGRLREGGYAPRHPGIDPITDALMGEGFYPSGTVYERVRRERQAVEIISDPADQRGLNARPANVRR